jgi:hypothetical protein
LLLLPRLHERGGKKETTSAPSESPQAHHRNHKAIQTDPRAEQHRMCRSIPPLGQCLNDAMLLPEATLQYAAELPCRQQETSAWKKRREQAVKQRVRRRRREPSENAARFQQLSDRGLSERQRRPRQRNAWSRGRLRPLNDAIRGLRQRHVKQH